MSVIVFATAMIMLVKSAEATIRGSLIVAGLRQPPTHVFMDDLISNRACKQIYGMVLPAWGSLKIVTVTNLGNFTSKGLYHRHYKLQLSLNMI